MDGNEPLFACRRPAATGRTTCRWTPVYATPVLLLPFKPVRRSVAPSHEAISPRQTLGSLARLRFETRSSSGLCGPGCRRGTRLRCSWAGDLSAVAFLRASTEPAFPRAAGRWNGEEGARIGSNCSHLPQTVADRNQIPTRDDPCYIKTTESDRDRIPRPSGWWRGRRLRARHR